jgi:hypothetical protein
MMKTHILAVLCIVGLMFFNALLEPAKLAAQAESLAHHTAKQFSIDKDEAWDFFFDHSRQSTSYMAMAAESVPYLAAIGLILILKHKKLLHD